MPVLLAAKKVGPSYFLTSAWISEKAKRGLGEVELKFHISAIGSELGRAVVGRRHTPTGEGVGEHVRASALYETYDAQYFKCVFGMGIFLIFKLKFDRRPNRDMTIVLQPRPRVGRR